MSESNDLKSIYQSISDEQPSEFTDALILKAAASALEKEKKTSSRWHLPVSIAAGAVFTITIVTQLNPWSDATFDSNTIEVDESRFQPASLAADSEELAPIKKQQVRQLSDQIQQKQRMKKSLQTERSLAAPQTRYQTMKIAEAPSQLKQNLTAQSAFIDDQLAVIEYYLEQGKLTLANKNLQLLLTKYTNDTLSVSQKMRIETIQTTIKQPTAQQ